MGTSGAFKGSGGKDAGDLRDAIAGWLGDAAPSDGVPPAGSAANPATGNDGAPSNPLGPSAIAPVIGLWKGGSRGSGGGGGGAGGGGAGGTGGGSSTGGRSSGGVRRTVARLSGPAGRASSLARAYATGNREALESAGLNYDDLRALDDPLEVGQRIAAVAFEAQADSTLEDSEARMIVAELVSWVLEAPEAQQPTPDEIVRRSIELMIARSALVEVGDTIRQERSAAKRHEAEAEVRRAAHVLASQVTLGDTGASAAAIAAAIENGVGQLKDIFGIAE